MALTLTRALSLTRHNRHREDALIRLPRKMADAPLKTQLDFVNNNVWSAGINQVNPNPNPNPNPSPNPNPNVWAAKAASAP